MVYCRAAGWGSSDKPEVLTDNSHPQSQEARDFLWSKTPAIWKQRIKILELKTASDLWKCLEETAVESAKDHLFSRMNALFGLRSMSDETVTQFTMRALSLRELVVLGGQHVDDATLVMLIAHGVPERLNVARNEVLYKRMALFEAMDCLQRAQNFANHVDGKVSHHTQATHRPTKSTVAHSFGKPPGWKLPSLAGSQCKRCGAAGHLASVCEASSPSTDAYNEYSRLALRWQSPGSRTRFNNRDRSGPNTNRAQ